MQHAKRLGLVALMALLTVNIYTGAPLFAVWVGSKTQKSGQPSMGAVFVVALTLAVVCFALVRALARVNAAYQDLTGAPKGVRQHAPWLRSMRGERPAYEGEAPTFSAMDRVLIVCVVLAVIAFEVWFFFFAGAPF
jgi:hypothetical protein